MQVDVAHKEAQLAALRNRRRRQARSRLVRRITVLALVLVAAIALALGEVFAGSSDALPSGQTIAGVDVGGLSTTHATQVLERRAADLALLTRCGRELSSSLDLGVVLRRVL